MQHRWTRLCAAICLFVGVLAVVRGTTAPTAPAATGGQIAAPALAFEIGHAGPAPAFSVATGTPPLNTDFELWFDGSVSDEIQSVVEAAAGIWSSVLDVEVPIELEVAVDALGVGYLGAAGPTSAFWGYDSFPSKETLYPVALANQLAGEDLDPAGSDIDMVLSSTVPWDLSIDGSGQGQSLLSVVLHEVGHGLGLTSWVHEENGELTITYREGGLSLALGYDRLVTTAAGAPIVDLTGAALEAALSAPLFWTGPQANEVNGSQVQLYSPSAFSLGSSVGHLDEATFTSELMTPYLSEDEPHTAISPLTAALVQDIGWRISSAEDPEEPPASSPGGSQAALYSSAFVDAVAMEFVGRPATEDELATWVPWLLGGGSRSDVTFAFANSPEWVGVLVDGLYRSTLGRSADPAGKSFWVETIRAGMTPARAAAEFYASDEYFRRTGGTLSTWIEDLYGEILGRGADPAGIAHWLGRASSASRQEIALEFYQSLESRQDRVATLFEELLGRAPDVAGWAYWTDRLADGRDVELATLLAASDEYLARVLQQFSAG